MIILMTLLWVYKHLVLEPALENRRAPFKPVQTRPLIPPSSLRHVFAVGTGTTAGSSAVDGRPSPLSVPPLHSASFSPPSTSTLPCSTSPRCCCRPPCCSRFCRARAGDISPRSAGAPSLRCSLPGSSSRWCAATRRTPCRSSSEPSSASTTRRTASRSGECQPPKTRRLISN